MTGSKCATATMPNRIRHIRYGNGVETAYTYDGDGNIRTLETKAGENVLLSFAYQYDGNGNRTAKAGTQTALGGITTGIMRWISPMAYDVRGQLLKSSGTALLFAMPMTKPETESGRRMYREKSVIFIMRRTSWSKRKALPIENSFLMTVRAV